MASHVPRGARHRVLSVLARIGTRGSGPCIADIPFVNKLVRQRPKSRRYTSMPKLGTQARNLTRKLSRKLCAVARGSCQAERARSQYGSLVTPPTCAGPHWASSRASAYLVFAAPTPRFSGVFQAG